MSFFFRIFEWYWMAYLVYGRGISVVFKSVGWVVWVGGCIKKMILVHIVDYALFWMTTYPNGWKKRSTYIYSLYSDPEIHNFILWPCWSPQTYTFMDLVPGTLYTVTVSVPGSSSFLDRKSLRTRKWICFKEVKCFSQKLDYFYLKKWWNLTFS